MTLWRIDTPRRDTIAIKRLEGPLVRAWAKEQIPSLKRALIGTTVGRVNGLGEDNGVALNMVNDQCIASCLLNSLPDKGW